MSEREWPERQAAVMSRVGRAQDQGAARGGGANERAGWCAKAVAKCSHVVTSTTKPAKSSATALCIAMMQRRSSSFQLSRSPSISNPEMSTTPPLAQLVLTVVWPVKSRYMMRAAPGRLCSLKASAVAASAGSVANALESLAAAAVAAPGAPAAAVATPPPAVAARSWAPRLQEYVKRPAAGR